MASILDRQIRHGVQLNRLAAGITARATKGLQRTIGETIAFILARDPGNIDNLEQIESLISQTQARMGQELDKIQTAIIGEMRHLADYEAQFQSSLAQEELPNAAGIAGAEAWRAALSTPLDGIMPLDYFEDLRREITNGIAREIRAGWANGEDTKTIIGRLVS